MERPHLDEYAIAVLVPCLNEEAAVASVVSDFNGALPRARIYVYDNGSDDRTVERAQAAGAVVRHERMRGKGNVVRRMFADVEADVYVLVDGDDTYCAAAAPGLVETLVERQLDMINVARRSESGSAYRAGHQFGNKLLSAMAGWLFGNGCADMLSGYRVLSRRFVKSFPALTTGFEIETELTVHALGLGMPIAEITAPYKERPPSSASKLRTYRDGIRILREILKLVKEERPLAFFGSFCAALATAAFILAYPLLVTYQRTGLVPRFPTAILSTGIMILAVLSLTAGLILASVANGRRELKRLSYLGIPALVPGDEASRVAVLRSDRQPDASANSRAGSGTPH